MRWPGLVVGLGTASNPEEVRCSDLNVRTFQ
jgi:hypothetical protein